MIFLYLFYEFAKIGLFTFGGGMATLPLLTDLATKTGWYGTEFVTEMVAISHSTPGPIGLNMATYVGYQVGSGVATAASAGASTMASAGAASAGVAGAGNVLLGILGAIIASIGIVTPCIIISLVVASFIKKFSKNAVVQNVLSGIRPVVLGLILYAAWTVAQTALATTGTTLFAGGTINYTKLIFFVIIFGIILVWKKHPGILILISAVAGIVIGL